MAQESQTDKLLKFYSECQSKGYTNMNDSIQSLKAKVIASDLNLNYNKIGALYEEARRVTEERKKQESTNGTLLLSCYSSSLYGKEQPCLEIYKCADNSFYGISKGSRIFGDPIVFTETVKLPQSYNVAPSATYYGVSYNGLSTGTVSYDPGGEKIKIKKTKNGTVNIRIRDNSFTISAIKPSQKLIDAFKREEVFKQYFDGNAIILDNINNAINSVNIYDALNRTFLPISECEKIAALLRKMIAERFPLSDQEQYEEAKRLMKSDHSSEIEKAKDYFTSLSNYKDSKELAIISQKRYEEVRQLEKEKAILAEEYRAKRTKQTAIFGGIALIIIFTVALLFSKVIKPENDNKKAYNYALTLYLQGEYEAAIDGLEQLGDYKDSVTKLSEIKAAIYEEAERQFTQGDYELAIVNYSILRDYKDSMSKLEEVNNTIVYENAIKLYKEGDYSEAYLQFLQIKEFRDVNDLLCSDANLLNAAKLEEFKTVGCIVKIGAYEQDNDASNGKEEIEWIVLDTTGNKSLLLSRYGLDCKCFNDEEFKPYSWDVCTLRAWLNDFFINAAFSEEEIKSIVKTRLSSYIYTSNRDIITEDSVFLLDSQELKHYSEVIETWSTNGRLGTKYAQAQKKKYISENDQSWWLRGYWNIQGNTEYAVGYQAGGNTQTYSQLWVRPSIWVSLNTIIHNN